MFIIHSRSGEGYILKIYDHKPANFQSMRMIDGKEVSFYNEKKRSERWITVFFAKLLKEKFRA